MAELELNCTHLECMFKTPKLIPALEMQMLAMHDKNVHRQGGQENAGAAAVKIEKVPRPVMKKGIGEDKFLYFQNQWARYKRSTGLTDSAVVVDQLLACCSEELSEDLYNLHGSKLDVKTEVELLTQFRTLAVVAQNNMVNIMKMRSFVQDRDEPVRSFLSKLKGASAVCKLTVKSTGVKDEAVSYADQEILHCLVKGLADEDIRQQVLGATDEMNLEATVKFIEVKEAGKKAGAYLDSGDVSGVMVSKMTGYKQAQHQELLHGQKTEGEEFAKQKCKYCGKRGHGAAPNFSKKREECPAFDRSCNVCSEKGHFAKQKACKKKVLVESVEVKHEKKYAELQAVNVKAVRDRKGNVKQLLPCNPIPHMVEVAGKMVIAMPEDHPKVQVEMQVDMATYENYGLEVKLGRRTRKGCKVAPRKIQMMCDTGAQVDCVSRAKMKELGLVEDELLKPEVVVGCANSTGAGVLGVFFGKVVAMEGNKKVTAKAMFYVLKNGGCLLSRSTCRNLGVIDEDFPRVGKYAKDRLLKKAAVQSVTEITEKVSDVKPEVYQAPGECDPDSELPCQCPRRDLVDPPESCPYPLRLENRDKIEEWVKKYFASSAFNVCRRQPMPCTEGPPMNIHTSPDAVPVALHKPVPVPLHWREQVRADIEADVKRGC